MPDTVSFFKYQSPSRVTAHPIPQLDILDLLCAQFNELQLSNLDLSQTAIIGVQHLLETTATLIQKFIELGISPENIFMCGKCYSTSPEVKVSIQQLGVNIFNDSAPEVPGYYKSVAMNDIRLMWKALAKEAPLRGIKKIIILDDGGRCFELMPPILRFQYEIAGVEQTRGGLYIEELRHLLFPIVEVASSAVKKLIEPPFIAEATINKVAQIMPHVAADTSKVCGVIGCGAIGTAIAYYLSQKGFIVAVYDEDPNRLQSLEIPNVYKVDCVKTLIANAEIVFGCTGKDISLGMDLLLFINKNTILVSCTSEDKEFLGLLKAVNQLSDERKQINSVLDDIKCLSDNDSEITIVAGGYPINFWGHEPWNVPARHIAATQALLFSGVLQAILYASKPSVHNTHINKPQRHMLSPKIQSYIVNQWQTMLEEGEIAKYYPDDFLEHFSSPEWIANRSGGMNIEREAFNLISLDQSKPSKLKCRL